MISSRRTGLTVALGAVTVLGLGSAATAAAYPGGLTTFTNGVGDTHSLFTVSGSTVTVTGDTSGANTYYLGGTQLVGFRSLFLVKTDGSAPSGVTTVANGGYVQDGATLAKTPYIDGTSQFGGYPGYDDNGPGKGFPNGSHFLVVADPTLAGTAASNNDTSGSFTFSGPIGGYDIGLDYILKGGATRRGYFAAGGGVFPAGNPAPAPEPSSVATLGLGVLGLAGLTLRARKRRPVA